MKTDPSSQCPWLDGIEFAVGRDSCTADEITLLDKVAWNQLLSMESPFEEDNERLEELARLTTTTL